MSDIPFKLIAKYNSAPLYVVPEFKQGECEGCCFKWEFEMNNTTCRHRDIVECVDAHAICVRDLDEYKVAAVTHKLTGKLP